MIENNKKKIEKGMESEKNETKEKIKDREGIKQEGSKRNDEKEMRLAGE